MASTAYGQGTHIRIAPRRVMIRCPLAEVAVDTGYSPKTVAIQPATRVLEACPACGQDHAWRIEDAFLDGMPDARAVGTAIVTRPR